MKTRLTIAGLIVATIIYAPIANAFARGDDFDAVVKIIEQFYHVKHQSLPLLARTGMKATRTVARIKGGDYKRLADAGSVRLAFFEDQDFNSHGRIASFKASMQSTLNENWSQLIQTLSAKDEEQTYIYIRDAGAKFHVLVVTLGQPLFGWTGISLAGSAKRLAQESGGEAVHVSRVRDYGAGLARIIGNLTARYNLGFALREEEKDDGRMHQLDLRVKALDAKGKPRKLDVSARRGYYAPKSDADQTVAAVK